MTIKVFNNLKEMKKYYDEETDTYIFRENDEYIEEIIINFDLNVESNIEAHNVRGTSISAKNINVWDIIAWEINACDIKCVNINAGMIKARDIDGLHIKSMNIYARDIKAFGLIAVNIYARDILYTTMCSAYEDIKCNSIKCIGRPAPLHYTIYGKLEVAEK